MHKLACKETGISSTCDFEARGETVEEVVDLGLEHARSAHSEDLTALGLSDADARAAMVQKVRESDDEVEASAE